MTILHVRISTNVYKYRVKLATLGKGKEHIGWYSTREEAVKAQDEAAIAHGLIKVKDRGGFRFFTQEAYDKQHKVTEDRKLASKLAKESGNKTDYRSALAKIKEPPPPKPKPLAELKGTIFYGL